MPSRLRRDGRGPHAPEPVPPKGYVEPVPTFYARLAALTAMTRTGLGDRGLLSRDDSANLERLEGWPSTSRS